MKSISKHPSGARRLHAALAETDPASTDLILVHPAAFRPAFRLPSLPVPPGAARPRGTCGRRKNGASRI